MGSNASSSLQTSSAAASSAVDGLATISANTADPVEIERMHMVRKRLCNRWIERNFTVREVSVYTRAGQGSSGASEAAALGGFCHTFILIETDSETYILERLLEGVRFSAVDDRAAEVDNAVPMVHSDSPISSAAIGQWVDQQARFGYSLTRNNCIHFAYVFVNVFTDNDKYVNGLLKFAAAAYLSIPGGQALVERLSNIYAPVPLMDQNTSDLTEISNNTMNKPDHCD